MRHHLVIGEAFARRCRRREIFGALRRMGLMHGLGPIGPSGAALLFRINPFGKDGQSGQRGLSCLEHLLLADAGGQGIDRFESRNLGGLFGTEHVIGMHHLGDAVEELDPSRDHATLARGKLLLQIIAARVKEDQLEGGCRILYHDPVGTALGARRVMLADHHLDRHDLRQDCIPDRCTARPVHT